MQPHSLREKYPSHSFWDNNGVVTSVAAPPVKDGEGIVTPVNGIDFRGGVGRAKFRPADTTFHFVLHRIPPSVLWLDYWIICREGC
jgi:hypothetical protein